VGVEAAEMKWASLMAALAVTAGLQVWGQEEAGNRAYRRGAIGEAVERYREAIAATGGSARLRYNLGTALLSLGEPEQAAEEFRAALEAASPELRARAFYNLGNALARTTGAGSATADDLRAAIEAYRRSLLLDPAGDDARWNLELALQRLQEVERDHASLSGPQAQRKAGEGEGPGAGAPQRPQAEGGTEPVPQTGAAEARPAAGGALADAPLPIELAEQVLRAVEERERDLQREKLRRTRKRVRGPDW
jgi:tetratricopeptide (TPR) repeat protein